MQVESLTDQRSAYDAADPLSKAVSCIIEQKHSQHQKTRTMLATVSIVAVYGIAAAS
jgi:hypothetical protein